MLDFINQIERQNKLRPQLRQILTHCRVAGFITPRSAISDYSIMSLARRINDLENLGYEVRRERRNHPATGQVYTRYYVTDPLAVASAA